MRAAGCENGSYALRFALLLSLLVTTARRWPNGCLPRFTPPADGLARDRVMRVVRDSRGFLWFCTDEGLSRFDGYNFTNYTTADGLPHPIVWDFLETRGGDYWVATWGGLARFDPAGTPPTRGKSAAGDGQKNPMFVVYRPPEKSAWSFKRLTKTARVCLGRDPKWPLPRERAGEDGTTVRRHRRASGSAG